MKYTALYRRYRPGTFDEMAGQTHVVKILKNQIKTGNIAHAYLLCGTRGTGKTSAARIFAKGVNCLSAGDKPCGVCENCVSIQNGTFFDVIEIDAASNNGVDNIRELRESVKYPPAAGLCKVYIIDEVHMLSQGAFNALLKTLEEPPAHVIFILATTEPHKLPATILSRCLRLDFRRVPEREVSHKLRQICEELQISYEESALSLIAAAGDGSVRDSLSILEQCLPSGEKELTRRGVVEVLGTAGEEAFIQITQMVSQSQTADALLLIDKISEEGKDLRQFTRDWIFHLRNLMMSKYAGKLDSIMNMSCENAEKVKEQGTLLSQEFISGAISELSKTSNQMRWSTQPRTLVELSVFKLSSPALDDRIDFLLQRIEKLENQASVISNTTIIEKSVRAVPAEPKGKEEQQPSKKMIEKKLESDQMESGSPEATRIWDTAFGKAALEKPSLNMLKGNVWAISLDEKILRIAASSEVMKRYAQQHKEYLEKLLKEQIKSDIKLEIVLSEEKAKPRKTDDKSETIELLGKLVGPDKLTITN